jgi:hypothetical protein
MPYILADDHSLGHEIRLAVVGDPWAAGDLPAGYLFKTPAGWRIDTAHLSYKLADDSDPMNGVYQDPHDPAVLVYMRARTYRKSYTLFGDRSRGLDIFVTFIAGQWVASVCEREAPYKLVVPKLLSPVLEEAKYMGLRKAHYVLFGQDQDPSGQLRACAQQEWDDIELPRP